MNKRRLAISILLTAILFALTNTVVGQLIVPVSSMSEQVVMYLIVAYVFFIFVVPGFIAGYGPEKKAFFAGAISGLIGGELGFSIMKIHELFSPFHVYSKELTTVIFGSFIAAIFAFCGAYIYGRKRSNNSLKADV